MARKLHSIARRFLVVSNALVAILYLLSSLAAYCNPTEWWWISYFGLAFPFLLLLMILFFFFWMVLRSPYALVSLAVLAVGIKGIISLFAWNVPHSFNYKKDSQDLRIVTWNVGRYMKEKVKISGSKQLREKMFRELKAQNADVICLQEFFYSSNPTHFHSLHEIRRKLNYPYLYFAPYDVDYDVYFTGSIIFSRIPFIDSGLTYFPRPTLQEALIYVDIKLKNDTIRIYNTRLQSASFDREDHATVEEIRNARSGIIKNSQAILSKLKTGFVNRSKQADMINKIFSDCPHPTILCVDMNDVPNSYAYNLVKDNKQDAFLKKGFGIGRTYSSISSTLRIDYIFASHDFYVQQFNRLATTLSDHYMLVTDLRLESGVGSR